VLDPLVVDVDLPVVVVLGVGVTFLFCALTLDAMGNITSTISKNNIFFMLFVFERYGFSSDSVGVVLVISDASAFRDM